MKKILFFLIIFFSFITLSHASANPYGKYQDLYGVKTVRCTWYAWQEAYNNVGVALPGWGNAQTWYNLAAQAGFSVGQVAKANSIAVWSSSDAYGHVAYVVSVDSDGVYMTVNEGGMPDAVDSEGIIIGSRKSTSAANLIGFIYLSDAPKNNSNSTSSNSSNKNNKLSSNKNITSLEIDIEDFSFDQNIFEYNLEVPYNKQIISIKGSPEDDKAIITGLGDKALQVGINTYPIIITAEDGSFIEYTINITRLEKEIKTYDTNKYVEEENKNNNIILIVGISSGVIILVIITGIVIYKKKKKI